MKRGINWLTTRIASIQAELDEYRSPRAYRDQEFSKAYTESGCTQREIAEVHGCTQPTVTYRLRLGRFLEFVDNRGYQISLKTLTERRFRSAWSETSGTGEDPRFESVVEILNEDTWRPNDVAEKIQKKQRKGQWFTAEEFSESEGIRISTVKTTLNRMQCGSVGACVIDDRAYKATRQYRIRERFAARGKVELVQYAELVSDLEDALGKVESVVVGKTWTSTGPKLIESELSSLKKRLHEARKFIQENSSRSASGDVRRKHRGFSVS